MNSYIKTAFIGITLTSIISSCGNKDNSATQQAKKPVDYQFVALTLQSTTLHSDYPPRLQGIMDIDIRPKVDGYIDAMYIDEGQEVKKGQLLFKIHNPQYNEDVENSKALIASAEAAVSSAQLQVDKTRPLVEQDIISSFELENAQLNLQSKKAALAQAKASYNNARYNQGYTTLTSPVNGVVGTLPYRIGSYVNSSTQLPLTTVSDISKIYAYFSINEKQQLAIIEHAAGATFKDKIKQMPAVELILSNGESYPIAGKIETFSGQVNAQTGSFNVRASFANTQHLLRSGSSATVRIPTKVENAIIIPQNATAELQDKRLAYIVADSNKVKAVPIIVREVPGGKFFVVDKGLQPQDKLIVEGIGILTEGTVINPVEVSLDSLIKETAK